MKLKYTCHDCKRKFSTFHKCLASVCYYTIENNKVYAWGYFDGQWRVTQYRDLITNAILPWALREVDHAPF